MREKSKIGEREVSNVSWGMIDLEAKVSSSFDGSVKNEPDDPKTEESIDEQSMAGISLERESKWETTGR